MVKICFYYLKWCLERDKDLYEKYFLVISGYVIKGYVCKFIKEEVERRINKIWYLFYYLVISFNKLGKICVVFDVVVKFYGILLND